LAHVKIDFIIDGLLILSFATLLFVSLERSPVQNVRGDGFASETLPPFYINGEKLLLFAKVSPNIINVGSTQNRYLDVRIVDYDTEELVQNASYQIMIYKDDKIIFGGKFHSQPGLLKIKMEPEAKNVKLTNMTSLSVGTWNTTTGNITIHEPIFLTPGLYHLSIKIMGLGKNMAGNIRTSSGQVFDSWLSVADVKNTIIPKGGTNYNTTIISYYDRISGVTFEPSSRTIAWSMPFDWNMSRNKHQNILVHEEVKVPRSLFNGSPLQYGAFVNGVALSGRSLAIDPFSSQNNTIVHLFFNKQEITKFLNQGNIDISNKRMSFNLTFLQLPILQSSSELETENGEVSISLGRIPEQLAANSKSILLLSFKDPVTGVPINADVTYGVNILDPNGKSTFNETTKTAIYNTTSRIDVSFPNRGIYQIWIQIEGLAPLDSDAFDTSRNGIARGYLLVE